MRTTRQDIQSMPKASLSFAKRNFKLPALALIALFISTFSQVSGQTGSDARARAQELLKQGDLQGAIELLRAAVKNDKADDDTWHALGLAYGLARETENSASAFKTAATLRLNRLAAGTPRATPSDQPGHVSAEFAQRYKAVVDSIERYIAASSNADVSVTADLDALRFYRDYYSGLRTDERIVAAREATKRLRVLSKPPPDFSGSRASGLAVLRALFSADGTVKHIVVVRNVEPIFDQACREAAKRIRFTPAIKDGQAVSTILQLEYSLNSF
jgi:tetratricopeptide (TPR) repeat protein